MFVEAASLVFAAQASYEMAANGPALSVMRNLAK